MKKKIIVVDDEKDILGLVEKILAFNNYSVALAKDGSELLEKLETFHPDLIILDVMMPGFDGYEICRRLKSEDATKAIPVMLLTVLADPSNIQKGKDAGATAYLTKPFEPRELEREIKKILNEV
ncbi:response regulator [bacterium]|nr:response regulator [bacterium]